MGTSNVKMMREALILARERIVETRGYYDFDADREDFEVLMATIDAALAAPPRNCDVGTPEEQIRRFEEYCQYRFIKSNCSECPLNDNNEDPSCFDLWLQMPYEEGGAK